MKKRKRRTKQIICLILAFAMIITLTPEDFRNIRQVRAEQQVTEPKIITEKEYTSNGCHVKYETKSSWANQAQIDMTITNNGTESMRLSEICFAYRSKIINIWNASIASQKEVSGVRKYVIAPESYNKLLNAGESIHIGFIAEGGNTPQAPEKLEIEGERDEAQGEVGATENFGGYCRITTEVSNQWDGGIIGKIIIENTGTESLKGWSLHFAWDGQIDALWNAYYCKDAEGYTLNAMDYNSEIAVGKKVEIGFQASGKQKVLSAFGTRDFLKSDKTTLAADYPKIEITPQLPEKVTESPSQTVPTGIPSASKIPEVTLDVVVDPTSSAENELNTPGVNTSFPEVSVPPSSTDMGPVTKTEVPTLLPTSAQIQTPAPTVTAEAKESNSPGYESPNVTEPFETEEPAGDFYVNENIRLTQDLVCDNLYITNGCIKTAGYKIIVRKNIYQQGQILYIQNSKITVNGDYYMENGGMRVENGSSLHIDGNFKISERAFNYRWKVTTRGWLDLKVGGNLLFSRSSQLTFLQCTKLTLKGNIEQEKEETKEDIITLPWCIYFNGIEVQRLQLSQGCRWSFRSIDAYEADCLELPDNVSSNNIYGISRLKVINGELSPNAEQIVINQDESIHGDLRLKNNKLCISGGAKVDIQGSLILENTQEVNFSTGDINIQGDIKGTIQNLFKFSGDRYEKRLKINVCGDTILGGGLVSLSEQFDFTCQGKLRLQNNCRLFVSARYSGSVIDIQENVEVDNTIIGKIAGVDFRIGKNFIQTGSASDKIFDFCNNTNVIFGKNCSHDIKMDSAVSVYWGNLDFSQSKGVHVHDCLYGKKIKGMDKSIFDNKLIISMTDLFLEQDEEINGTLELRGGILRNDNYKLHIKGDLLLENAYAVGIKSDAEIDGDIRGSLESRLYVENRDTKSKVTLDVAGSVKLDSGCLTLNGCITTNINKNLVLTGTSYLDSNTFGSHKSLSIRGICRLDGDQKSIIKWSVIELKGDFHVGKGGIQSDEYDTYFVVDGETMQQVTIERPDQVFLGRVECEKAKEIYVKGKLRGRNISGLNVLKSSEEWLDIEMDNMSLAKDEIIHDNIRLSIQRLMLNGHSMTIKGNLHLVFRDLDIMSKRENNIEGGRIDVAENMKIDAAGEEDNYGCIESTMIHVGKDFTIQSGILYIQTQTFLETGENCIVNGALCMEMPASYGSSSEKPRVRLTIGNNLEFLGQYQSRLVEKIKVSGDIVQNTKEKFNNLSVFSITLILNGNHKQTVQLPYLKEKLDQLDLTNSDKVTLSPNIWGDELRGVDHIEVANGKISSNFILNWIYSEAVIDGSLDCVRGGLYVRDGSAHIKGDYTQNNTGGVDLNSKLIVDGNFVAKASFMIGDYYYCKYNDTNDKVHIKGNAYIRKAARIYMIAEDGILQVDGDLQICNSEYFCGGNNGCWWSCGTLILGGDLRAGKYTDGQHSMCFTGTTVILNGKKPQKIDTSRSPYNFTFSYLDMKQAERVTFTNSNLHAKYIWGYNKIANKAITLKDMHISLQNDEEYNGELLLINSTMDLNKHRFRIKGNLEQISSIVLLNGGTLHTNGYYIVGASVLRMTDPGDMLRVDGDFIMKSTLNHLGQLSNGTMKLAGDFLQDGNECSFASDDKFKIAFIGDGVQKVHFGDEINSKFANIDPNFADYQMDDTPLYMTARLSYHIALGMVQGFQELLGMEDTAALVRNLIAGLGVGVILTTAALPETVILVAGQIALMVSGMMGVFMTVSAAEGLYDTTQENGGIYDKAEKFAKNSIFLIVNVFGTFMSAKQMAEWMSNGGGRFERILKKQKDQSVFEIIQDEREYPVEQFETLRDSYDRLYDYVGDKAACDWLVYQVGALEEDQWRAAVKTAQKCRKELGEKLDKDDIICMLDAMGDEEQDVAGYVKAQKKARMYAAWSTIKNGDDFEKFALEIGRNNDLSIEQRVERLQELFEYSPYKKDIHVPRDVKYVKKFSEEGYVIYDWPEKEGFVQAHSITRENPLPEIWDRYGRMGGSNFADVPKEGKYNYSQRAIPYYDNLEAYHIGHFHNETYFDKIDAIRNNDIEKLNKILKKEHVDTVDEGEFAKMREKYTDFIRKIEKEIPDVDATYGLRGKTAPMGDLEGGANQFLTPLSGEILKQLGILAE